MATTEELILGTQATIFPSTTAALGSTAYALSAANFNNIQGGGGGGGYPRARLTLNVTFAVAPTVPSSVNVWLLTSEDGTTFETGSATVAPARTPDLVMPLIAVTTAQQLVGDVAIPVGLFSVLVQNAGSGQPMPLGWTLKLTPYTRQSV